MAVIALSSVNSGPPNSAACWPVTMATARGSRSCAAAASAPPAARRGGAAALRRTVRDRLALPRMLLRAGDRVAPRSRIGGIAGKELGDARVVERVVGRQPPDPGEPSNVDGESHGGVSSPARQPRARVPRLTRRTVGAPPGTVAEPRAQCQLADCLGCLGVHLQAPYGRMLRSQGFTERFLHCRGQTLHQTIRSLIFRCGRRMASYRELPPAAGSAAQAGPPSPATEAAAPAAEPTCLPRRRGTAPPRRREHLVAAAAALS